MDREHEDYTDLDLPPPLQWSRAWSAILGLVAAVISFVFLMLLILIAFQKSN
jgi:hypothetical protein